MAQTITIADYTSRWDEAMRPQAPEPGDEVRVAQDCDAREWGGFVRALSRANLDIDFSTCGDDDFDEYRVYAIPADGHLDDDVINGNNL